MIERIRRDIREAMKRKDILRLSTLRMVLSELQYMEKEKGLTLDEQSAGPILQSMVRKRKEAAEQFRKGSRSDLADKELREIEIIAAYLPEQLGDDEIRRQVTAAMAELGVQSPKEMGKVMGVLIKKLSGRADGGSISRIVKEELQKLTV